MLQSTIKMVLVPVLLAIKFVLIVVIKNLTSVWTSRQPCWYARPEVAVEPPRPTIRQVSGRHKSCRPDGTGDVGPKLTEYGKRVATEQTAELSGFVFCAKSPSCGMERIKIYNEQGTGNTSEGVGFFAEQIMAHNPLLPCEENGRLNDMHLRENFVMRVYAYKHWQTLNEQPLTVHRLTQFHAQYKYLLMAHNYEAYRNRKLLGTFDGHDIQALASDYIFGLMTALKSLLLAK